MQYKSAYIWGLFSKFIPQGIYLLTTIVLARYLTPEDFGMIGVLSIIFTVATVLMDSGLGGSLIKEREISALDCSSISCFNVFVSILIYSILFLSADFIEGIYEIDGLSRVIKALGLVFPITSVGLVPKSLLQRRIEFKTIFWNYLLGVFIGSIVSIIVAIKGGGVYALVAYQLITNAVNVTANIICSKYNFSLKLSFSSLKRLLPFGIFTSIISIIDTIYENLMTALVGKFLNVRQAGYLYQGKRIENTLSTSLAGAIGVVTFPILTKHKDDLSVFNREALSTLKNITALSFPILITVAVFSKEIIVFLFGEKWIASGFYLEMLTFAGLFLIIETLIRNFIKALCQVKKLMYATIIKRLLGIAILILSMIIKPDFIVFGYIISSFIGYVINSILFIKLSRIKVFSLITATLSSFVFCIAYYILFKALTFFGFKLLFKVLISVAILALYYFIALPLTGINILSIIKRK